MIEDIQIQKQNGHCSFACPFFVFARHGRALTGESPEHAQVVGNV